MMNDLVTDIAGCTVSRETFARLERFEQLVRRWTETVNLVSKASVAEIWTRHIADSAQIFAFCPPEARHWIDLGSGGGFPGLVVAVLAQEKRPALRVSLVESDQRKATFLRQAAQALGVDVDVQPKRIESLDPAGADVVSARALAALSDLLCHAERHLRPDGVAIFPKGARFREEVAEAQRNWTFELSTHASRSDAEAAILVIRKIHRVQEN